MSWTSTQVTQNGNSTATWGVSGSSLSAADDIVVRPTSGSSSIRVNSVTVRLNPIHYDISVSVIGGGAMAFKFSAEEMD
jgi:hypothetical protein